MSCKKSSSSFRFPVKGFGGLSLSSPLCSAEGAVISTSGAPKTIIFVSGWIGVSFVILSLAELLRDSSGGSISGGVRYSP